MMLKSNAQRAVAALRRYGPLKLVSKAFYNVRSKISWPDSTDYPYWMAHYNAAWKRSGSPSGEMVEFVCPFHRGDVLLGLCAACTAAKQGIHVRMHVSQELIGWLEDFKLYEGVTLEPINIGIPCAEQTRLYLCRALKTVWRRKDVSGHIICSHPVCALEELGISLAEYLLQMLGLPAGMKLTCVPLRPCAKAEEQTLREKVGYELQEVVLLHPAAGWALKSMPPEIIRQIIGLCHAKNYRVVQIGGSGDPVAEDVDGMLLENLTLREWGYLFRSVRAVVGVDSWTAHFAAMVHADQAILYGSTSDRYVGSKRYFEDRAGKCVTIPSLCEKAPCNLLNCESGYKYCRGMNIADSINEVLKRIE